MALDNDPHGGLAPLRCLPRSDLLVIQLASNGAMTHPLLPPFQNETEDGCLLRVFDKLTVDQTRPIGSGANTYSRWNSGAPDLAFGMRPELHSPIQERLPNRGLRYIELTRD